MSVKTRFSIKDLENLSGIKAHTIRIWEKRYNLLQPERTQTNIRHYNLANLMKLLNTTYLYNHGVKISKIAKLSEKQIHNNIQEIGIHRESESFAITEMKAAMLAFDSGLFKKTYQQLVEKHTFREIFYQVFLPLLSDIGLLWQTGTITPAHERFISEWIKQKIILHIDKASEKKQLQTDRNFVLFLPLNEVHEIGLLYLHFELLNHGYPTVYLGNNIPVENLQQLLEKDIKTIFISYFTVQPKKEKLDSYLAQLQENLDNTFPYEVWLFGQQIQSTNNKELPENFTAFPKVSDFLEHL